MRVLAIDPGTTKSGWCLLEDGVPTKWAWADNESLVSMIFGLQKDQTALVIEDVGNYGTPMGRDTIETIKWMGRFDQSYVDMTILDCRSQVTYIMRPTIKTHLCGVASAKDGNVRQALIDRFGGDEVAIGGKKCQTCKGKGWKGAGRPVCEECNGDKYETPPGVLHGISGHAWSALAVGVTYLDQVTVTPAQHVSAVGVVVEQAAE